METTTGETTLDREVARFERDVEELRERPRRAATTERTAVGLTLADRLVRGSYFVDVRTLTLNGSGENQKVIVQGYRHGGPGSVNEPTSIDLRPDETVRVVAR